jgi:HAMP domain-containing protein
MKKVLAALVAALVVLGAALYLFVARPLLRPSEVTAVAERAVATDDLLLLAGINVKQAVFLERWFLGSPRVTPVAGSPPPAVVDRTLLDHLRTAGVGTRHDVAYALYALYPADGSAPRHAVILVGRFNPAAINAYLIRELAATPRPGPGPAAFTVTRIDPATCQPGASWVVTVAREWIVLADPISHPTLLSRLASAPDGSSERLGWWRGLAREDVASVGVPGLEQLESGATQPFAKGGAKALAGEAAAFGRVYLGVGVKTVPPQGVLRVVVDAKDAARGAEKIRAWEQTLNESRSRWKDTMPSVPALYDSVRVRTAGPRSTIEFTVDRTLAANSQRVVDELLAAAFGGLGVRVNPPSGQPPAERIDTEPIAFVPAITPAALPAYDPQAQFAEEVDQIQGPFGLRLGELRLGADPAAGQPPGLQIVVEGFANEVPNVGASEDRVRLFVDSVKATGGQELLRPETCGRERNNQPATFKSAGGRRLRAGKTVRLIAGADPKALQSVTGRVQLRLPTRTEVVTLAHPTPRRHRRAVRRSLHGHRDRGRPCVVPDRGSRWPAARVPRAERRGAAAGLAERLFLRVHVRRGRLRPAAIRGHGGPSGGRVRDRGRDAGAAVHPDRLRPGR